MFIKKLSLYLCVISLFSLNQAEAVLGEKYFKQKKYAFSEPVLDETKAFFAIAMKAVSITDDEAEEVFLHMWEEALQGNEKVQKKLFCLFTNATFYETAKNRVSLLAYTTRYSLEILIEMGIVQEKSWAFYQKALAEKKRGKKFTLLNQAMNNPNIEEGLLEKIAAERNSLIREFGIPIPSGKNKNEIKKFIEHYKNYKNAGLLYEVYKNNKQSNKVFAEECFKAACELGWFLACIDQANEFFSKGDLENVYKWSLKPAKIGDPMSMYNVGVCLVTNGQVEEGLKWFLKASEAGLPNAMYAAAHVLSNFFDYPVNQIKKFNLIKTAVELGQIKINELIQDRAPIALVTEIKSIYIKAINKFAKMLKDGFAGNDPNLEEAAHLFLKVIKSDDAEQKDKASAMYYYGHLIKEGFMGQRPNKNMGNDFILKAAKSGCAAAMNHYGGFLMGWIDNDVEKNAAAAYRWFLKAAKAGDHASMSNVGEILWFGVNGVKQNRKEAKKWLYKAANAGYLDAMILLSRDLFHEAFEEGVSVEEKEKLLKEAAPLLCLANGSNYFDCLIRSDLLLTDEVIVKSQVRLDSEEKIATGLLLRDENTENDVLQNKDETESSNKPECKLASEVDLEGDRLLENKTIDHDLSQRKLKKIFRSKFELQPKDKVTALVNLAQLYFHGYVDGEKNIKKAFELLLPIAKNNYPEAMNYIGRLFLQETEEQKPNYKKAFKWFRGAAENGHVDSMVRLGSLILLSFDFSKNDQSLSDALFWFQKADSLGSNDAAAYLEICENLLKENAELDVTDEEISRFIEVNDVSNPNKSLHSLVMPSKIEDDIINEDKDDHVEIPQSDDSLINVVFSNDSINECKVTEPLDDVRINVQSVNNNPKFQREQLRRIGLLKKNQEVNYSHKILKLSAKNQLIVNMLLDRTIKFKNVDYTQLVNLFKDPFFENQVSVIKSKSGCVITAKNYKTLDYVAASTHKKHNKTYDGLNPFFARDLLKILALFGHTEG